MALPFHPQPHPEPRAVTSRREAKLVKDQAHAVPQQVRERDKYRCRACGTYGDASNPIDVHHLKLRSAGSRGETTANQARICRSCHSQIHAYRLFLIGPSANGHLRVERHK